MSCAFGDVFDAWEVHARATWKKNLSAVVFFSGPQLLLIRIFVVITNKID